MDVAIAGGHGNVARRLARRLVARGDSVRALIRNPDHGDDVRADGSEPVPCDLEQVDVAEVARAVAGADAVVFAAGAGPGSGAGRKWTMDRDGAIKLVDAARSAGVERYVMISSIGAENPPAGDDVFSAYLRAKAEADRALAESGLDFTIVRPGRLTNDPPTGRVTIGSSAPRGSISRGDVAAVLLAALEGETTIGKAFELVSGETPIPEAMAVL
jgi:nucleoside-diphosphate-sugar epimerase